MSKIIAIMACLFYILIWIWILSIYLEIWHITTIVFLGVMISALMTDLGNREGNAPVDLLNPKAWLIAIAVVALLWIIIQL